MFEWFVRLLEHFASQNIDWVYFALGLLPVAALFLKKEEKNWNTFFAAAAWFVFCAGFLVGWSIVKESIPFGLATGVLFLYSTSLFLLLCLAVELGLGRTLTRWRDDKWAKEMEYVYLSFGLFGAIMSLSKAQFLVNRHEVAEMPAAMLVATAIVIRTLKTRVELSDWNKKATWGLT
mgnify:CR=1 FL=1